MFLMKQMGMRKLACIHDTQQLLNEQRCAVTSIWFWKLTSCNIYYIDFLQRKFCQSNKAIQQFTPNFAGVQFRIWHFSINFTIELLKNERYLKSDASYFCFGDIQILSQNTKNLEPPSALVHTYSICCLS